MKHQTTNGFGSVPETADLGARARWDRLHRLERVANRLDARFRMPVLGVRFGWDSVIGLIPGVGDMATALPGLFMIYEGAQIGARRRTLLRMGANTAVDFAIGSIPLVGDVFDLYFKSHRKNVALLRRELERKFPRMEEAQARKNRT